MKLTITYTDDDFCSAHKFAMMFKGLTGLRFEEIDIGSEKKIIFRNIHFSNNVVNGVRRIMKNTDIF